MRIGMLLTYRLIENHEGKISFTSTENVEQPSAGVSYTEVKTINKKEEKGHW